MAPMTWLLVAAVVVLLWAYSRWRLSYWAKRGILSPPAMPFLGHVYHFVLGQRWIWIDKFYHKFSGHKMWGTYEFLTPVLMVADPELLKEFLVKDFDHFAGRRMFGNQEGSLAIKALINTHGDDWKGLRSLMSTTFTSGKMRGMCHLICKKADNLVSFCIKQAAGNRPINMKDMFGRYAIDTIASCAFGMECNSLSDSKPIFVDKAERFFMYESVNGLRFCLMVTWPKLYNALGFKVDTPEVEFFADTARQNIAAREQGQKKRGDFLDLLLEARDSEESFYQGKKVFGKDTLVAQIVMFLMVGYDTTANALAFAAFILAKYPEHQERLRQEMQELVKEHGSVTYQDVMEAKYLDACFNETLRLYPPLTVQSQLCTKTYKVPGTDLTLLPGDTVSYPVWCFHHDPQYWKDPEEYRPERFLPENKGNIQSGTHIPFGMGPRNCIGMRFALMEAKVALAHLILAAEWKLAPGHEELTFENSPFILRPRGGVQVLLTPLKEE